MYNDKQVTYLVHHGIRGQRWGIRRFQNLDGSLTKAGAKRYGTKEENIEAYKQRKISGSSEEDSSVSKRKYGFGKKNKTKAPVRDIYDKSNIEDLSDDELKRRTNRIKLERDYVREVPRTREEITKERHDKAKEKIQQAILDAATEGGKKVLSYAIEQAGKKLTNEVLNPGNNNNNNKNNKNKDKDSNKNEVVVRVVNDIISENNKKKNK